MGNTPTPEEYQRGAVWEQPTADVVSQHIWPGTVAIASRPYSQIDFAIVSLSQKVMVAYLEVKRRFVPRDTFATTMVVWEKYEAAYAMKRYFNVNTYGVVVFDDGVVMWRLDEMPDNKEMFRRKDRAQSERWYALYKIETMTFLDDMLPAIKKSVDAAVLQERRIDIPPI